MLGGCGQKNSSVNDGGDAGYVQTSGSGESSELVPEETTEQTTLARNENIVTDELQTETQTAAEPQISRNELDKNLLTKNFAELTANGIWSMEPDECYGGYRFSCDEYYSGVEFMFLDFSLASGIQNSDDISAVLPVITSNGTLVDKIIVSGDKFTVNGVYAGMHYSDVKQIIGSFAAKGNTGPGYFEGSICTAGYSFRSEGYNVTLHFGITETLASLADDTDGRYIFSEAAMEQADPKLYSIEIDKDDLEGSPVFTSFMASSKLAPIGDNSYEPEKAMDGRMDTCWCEGVNGLGIGESITFASDTPQLITSVRISNGLRTDRTLYEKNARPTVIKMEFDDGTSEEIYLSEDYGTEPGWNMICSGKYVKRVKFTIMDAAPGNKYEDTCISEIELK